VRQDLLVDLDHLNLRVQEPEACRAFYERWFGFRHAFDADGGPFLQNDAGFLLALIPADPHVPLPPGVHIGFRLESAEEVVDRHRVMAEAGIRTSPLEDHGPDSAYVSFRCWDPDGTEVEQFWDG
jgi:catechol 2,3-dioxygenase-like lactoylglutathione lyase family enzyme